MPVRIVSWNLAGRVRNAPRQMEALLRLAPDVLALQEITDGSWRTLETILAGAAFKCVNSMGHAPRSTRRGPRKFGLVIAARVQPRAVSTSAQHPWPERVLLADLVLRGRLLRVITAHVPPGSSNGWKKVLVLEALAAELLAHRRRTAVFVGDLNCPQEELPDGRVVTWAQTRIGPEVRTMKRFRGRPGWRWDEAERALTEALPDLGYVDAYRRCHGWPRAPSAFSWYSRAGSRSIGRRFDHAFCTPKVQVRACRYVSRLREGGLSDHAPVELTVEL